MWSEMYPGIDDSKGVFVYFFVSEGHNPQLQWVEYERKTIRTLEAKEMYYGLLFSYVE